jgi:L-iditol 2-dehydrogenase
MKAAVLHAKNDLRYEDIPDPKVGDNDVLVKVKTTGICGSDIPRVLDNGAHYYPIILGHEFAGEVIECGKNVKKLSIGDKVTGAPLVPCMKCADCQRGDYSQCKHYTFIGSRIQGSFAELISIPEPNAVKFHQNTSFEQGAFFEPSTVALHGLRRLNYTGGANVAILGGGTIGIFTAQWARILGAKSVTVFDVVPERLELARKLGVTYTINSAEDFKEKVKDITSGQGFEFVYETAGLNVTMNTAFEIAANKAQVCFIGNSHKPLTFDHNLFEKMYRKEFMLTGSWMSYSAPFPGSEWELTAHYFSTGELKFDDSLIFKRFPLSNIAEAFAMYNNPRDVKGKLLIIV